MPKQVKLAILRARHDPNTALISDQACLQMLMTSQSRRSVLNYWTDVTEGYLEFDDTEMFPWVDVTIAATDISRGTQIRQAYDASSLLENADLTRFDGFVVLSLPGFLTVPNPDAGKPDQPATVTLGLDGGSTTFAGKGAAALPVMSSDHTFMCHEVGHVLGFKHTYGVWNNGIDWDGKPPWDQGQVYGDPYDIMSSASFGKRTLDPSLIRYSSDPTFAGAAVVGWPYPSAVRMGPAPARAHVHLWDPSAIPASRVRHLTTPGSGAVQTARLFRAGTPGGSTELVVVHPISEDSEGRGRCYVEYRSVAGWDAGLDVAGPDLARRAVVVHTVAGAAGETGVRCWYRGRIPVPVEIDTDLAVEGTWLVVRVTGEEADGKYVDVEISTGGTRAIALDLKRRTEIVGSVGAQMRRTRCGDELEWATWIQKSTHAYIPHTRGYGGAGAPGVIAPLISWTVGGTAVPTGSGTLAVTTADGVFGVDYDLDAATGTLLLTSRAADRYTTEVAATATEPGGGNPTTVNDTFNPPGSMTGFRPSDVMRFDRCLGAYLHQVGLRARDFLLEPDPNPRFDLIRDRINEGRLRAVAGFVALSRPAVAQALEELINLRYQGERQFDRSASWSESQSPREH